MIGDIPLMSMLKSGMRWHEARQRVLAANVANADTPGYVAKDIARPDFSTKAPSSGVSLATTSPLHFAMVATSDGFAAKPEKSGEITPRGNGVDLEDEVMQMTQNVMDFQMVSQLYSRGLDVLRTAIGKKA
jgi:flagellar basal-body rod protein FlgB